MKKIPQVPSTLAELAAEMMAEEMRVQTPEDESLFDFIPRITPEFTRPDHFKKYEEQLTAIVSGKGVWTCLSAPPRHGKSETATIHAAAMFLIHNPKKNVAFFSFSETNAVSFSLKVQDAFIRAGGKLHPRKRGGKEWMTESGGVFLARGVHGGSVVGRGIDLYIVDDPFSGRTQVESPVIREKVWDWFISGVITRLQPSANLIVTHCIAKDEPIQMADGSWKAVQNVAVGDIVSTFDIQSSSWTSRKVLASKLSGNDLILKISTKRKSLRVNERHPFLLDTGEWKKAGELAIGDEVFVASKALGSSSDVSEEWAWFFGFMMGDGWVTNWGPTKNKWCVCAAKSTYPELNERVCKAFETFFGKRPTETKFGYYRLDSVSAGKMLTNAGLVGGAHGKRIPEWVFSMKPELKKAYIGGYIDSDGHKVKRSNDSYVVASVSHDLMNDTRLLCISAGVIVGRVVTSVQIVQAPHSKEPKQSVMHKCTINFANNPDKYETITDIMSENREDVYDLTIDGTENFVAGGFVVHNTRWSPDDLIGRIADNNKSNRWTIINIPAISYEGVPLWPERYTLEDLENIRETIGEHEFQAEYMGMPRVRGELVFNNTYTYSELPRGLRFAIGCDFAYTENTYSDYSVAVVLGLDLVTQNLYVIEVVRKKTSASKFGEILKSLQQKYGMPKTFAYIGGVEKGVIDLLKKDDVKVATEVARADKLARAVKASNGWNQGKILLPFTKEEHPWTDDFVQEVLTFTGKGDKHDDQVDALVAAYDSLAKPPPARGMHKSPLPFF